jgi:hypothetical protein
MAAWTPTHLGTTVKAWYKADAITGVINGDPISTWVDSSTFGNNLTAAGAARPTLDTSGPFAEWNNSGRSMTSAASTSLQDVTWFAVARAASTAANSRTIVGASASGGIQIRVNTTTSFIGVNKQGVAAIANSTAATTDTEAFLVAVSLGATTYAIGLDGDLTPDSGNHAQTLTAARTLAIGVNSGAEFWDDAMYEILCVSPAVSEANRQLVEGYLGHRWSVALASGHPYETSAPQLSGKTGLRFCISFGLRQRTLR